ncbi:hypothetical protein [Nemorincola caseinilytica]|uniref:hypothetical protein n=1 Tax=Nemorincola caseinilytica TaxID=2054315 RepID=UPI0031EDA5BD
MDRPHAFWHGVCFYIFILQLIHHYRFEAGTYIMKIQLSANSIETKMFTKL